MENAGPYRLIRRLGEGGMGIVYLAEQTAPIRREVAVKVINPGLDSEKVLARFLVERQVLANLNHAGISKVYDAGVTADGRPYVVMEYVDGSSLTRFCDDHRLPVAGRLELFLQVCAAIQHAHQKGIIHRDVKPSNLLVTVADGRPLVKVIDFGIAKALQPSPEEALLTQTGSTLGTPEYMSPEQATLGDVDTRSDVYALGVVLYELLIGVRPFEAKDIPRGTPLALFETVRDKEAPKLTTRLLTLQGTANDLASLRGTDVKGLLRQLGGELEWITLKALEKQPSRRYASAAELAADIERHMKSEPVLAGPPSTLYRLGKLARRHRMAVAALSVVAATILGGAVVSTLFLGRAVRAERLARRELRESLLNQAVILSNSSELDRRERALTVLSQAATIFPGLDARNAALRSLSIPGFHVIRQWSPYVGGAGNVWPDLRLERYARTNEDGSLSIRAMRDDVELLSLPSVGVVPVGGIFSPDGSWLAVEYQGELRVWNLSSRSSRSLVKTLKAVRFTQDSSGIIANSGTHLHLFDLRRGDETAVLRFGGVDVSAPGLDDNGLADAANFEHEVPDRQPFAGAEHDVLPLERAETLKRNLDGVPTGPQVRDLKVSPRIADRLARLVGSLGGDRDGGAGNDLTLGVSDGSGDGPGNGLGEHDTRRKDGPGDQEQAHQS